MMTAFCGISADTYQYTGTIRQNPLKVPLYNAADKKDNVLSGAYP